MTIAVIILRVIDQERNISDLRGSYLFKLYISLKHYYTKLGELLHGSATLNCALVQTVMKESWSTEEW